MIEPMYFVTVTGPKEDLERVTDRYLSQYSIQLENALTILKNNKKLRPFTDADPYREYFAQSEVLKSDFQKARIALPDAAPSPMDSATAVQTIQTMEEQLREPKEALVSVQDEKHQLEENLALVEQFIGLNYDLNTILHFNFLQFRFGRIANEYYAEMMEYLNARNDSIFSTCKEYDDYVWGVYFVPKAISARVDAVYASLHFERFYLPDGFEGTPQEAADSLRAKLAEVQGALQREENHIRSLLTEKTDVFCSASHLLEQKSRFFGVRRLAACYTHNHETYYILCGWMPQNDAIALKQQLDPDPQTYCSIEKESPDVMKPPPTKLKNASFFRPFELFVEMYGLPNYKEMDPTILFALTYSFFFGFMFGDLGQGLCLLAIGSVLAWKKKSRLGAIIARCGFFSAVFGTLFGSVFGFEDIIPALWLRPAKALLRVPGIGMLNAVFIVAVLIGMLMILLMMGFSIVNHLHMHESQDAWFDTNGISGFLFYLGIFVAVLSVLMDVRLPGGGVLWIFFVVPLLLIFFKEPLSALCSGNRASFKPENPVMFFVQGFFELFEVLLSYFSNTLSFVRVGAFAVSHASMMGVVLMLSGAETGTISWPAVVFGNLFVCAMEGLIVGIQVLRLEYYELFSRFYRGDGRPFQPYNLSQSQ